MGVGRLRVFVVDGDQNLKFLKGLIQVSCRLTNSHLSFDARQPTIFQNRHHLIDVLVQYACNGGTNGGNPLSGSIRKRLGIPQEVATKCSRSQTACNFGGPRLQRECNGWL